MRGHPVDGEKALWWRLRGRKLGRLKFRCQHLVGRFIADFVCLEVRLIVELDGNLGEHRRRPSDRRVKGAGIRRDPVENDRLRVDIEAVCEEIVAAARSRLGTPHPAAPRPPSPTRGEG